MFRSGSVIFAVMLALVTTQSARAENCYGATGSQPCALPETTEPAPAVHKPANLAPNWRMAAETSRDQERPAPNAPSTKLAGLSESGQLVEYAAPAATVRTFYEALEDGRGEVASLMVAPEKRGIPAFSASAMSHFYGSLRQPLRLTDIEQSGPDTFIVYYRYAAAERACNGKAIVKTSTRGGANYIENISALNGC
jgi:hypothetical protein